MKTKIIHSKKVAEELIKRNNNLLTIEKHNKNIVYLDLKKQISCLKI